jgi:D-alanyl-lipoteichoic acid acyltransferase DltB (MBOAT superfamily)
MRRITWGLFKKVVIADRLAAMVDFVYQDPHRWNGFAIVLTIVFFSVQIYCDFSGYSDIAVGTARIMGFNLMENFHYPLYSKNITEFWRRWHISLSSWFRDYVYIPLGGNRVSRERTWLNLMMVFLLSGIWHGANWTFVVWGGLHGLAVIVESVTKKQRNWLAGKLPAWLYDNISMVLTFAVVGIIWLFFRSANFKDAVYMVTHLFTRGANGHYFTLAQPDLHGLPPNYMGLPLWQFALTLTLVPLLIISEWLIRNENIRGLRTMPAYIRWSAYYVIIFCILFLGLFDTKQFIYFQF